MDGEAGEGEERDGRGLDGGDAVSSSFTFFCTSGGKGLRLASSCMHERLLLIHGGNLFLLLWDSTAMDALLALYS